MELPLLSLSLNNDAETGMTPEERRIQASINKKRNEARKAASKRDREANRLAKQNNPTPRAKPAKKKAAPPPASGPKSTPAMAFPDEDEDLQPVQEEDKGYDSWGTFSDDDGAKEPRPPGPLAQAYFESEERIQKEAAEKKQRERMEAKKKRMEANQKRQAEQKAAEERRKEMEKQRQSARNKLEERKKLQEKRDVELDDLFDSFNMPDGE